MVDHWILSLGAVVFVAILLYGWARHTDDRREKWRRFDRDLARTVNRSEAGEGLNGSAAWRKFFQA